MLNGANTGSFYSGMRNSLGRNMFQARIMGILVGIVVLGLPGMSWAEGGNKIEHGIWAGTLMVVASLLVFAYCVKELFGLYRDSPTGNKGWPITFVFISGILAVSIVVLVGVCYYIAMGKETLVGNLVKYFAGVFGGGSLTAIAVHVVRHYWPDKGADKRQSEKNNLPQLAPVQTAAPQQAPAMVEGTERAPTQELDMPKK